MDRRFVKRCKGVQDQADQVQGGQNMRRSNGARLVRHQSAERVLLGPGIGGTLGKKIGQEAAPGEVICLYGDLGVGKTVFTKGLADGLGITEPIQSPTFTIVREYEEGRLPLYHFDVYRIGDIEEMDEYDKEILFEKYSIFKEFKK